MVDNRISRRNALLATLFIALLAPSTGSANAGEILQHALGSLSGIHTIQADVHQEVTRLKRTTEYTGHYVARDKSFRLELTEPNNQTIVYDGHVLQWYVPEKKELLRSESGSAMDRTMVYQPQALTQLAGSGFSYEAFREKHWLGLAGEDIRFVLTPKEPRADFSRLEVLVDAKTERLKRIDLFDTEEKLSARQSFEGACDLGGDKYFPRFVSVEMWTPVGRVESRTRYEHVRLNEPVKDESFVLETTNDVETRTMPGQLP
jgi:outer membrane lipoprotein-sorting protein